MIKSLYDRGFDGDQIRLLFRFLDAITDLPRELVKALSIDLAAFEKERAMPYVSSIERIGREEGKEEGKKEGMREGRVEAKVESLMRLLSKRFKTALPAELEASVRSTDDLDKLDAWFDSALEVNDLAEFRRMSGI